MSDTKTFVENPSAGAGWGAGVGGLIGAAIGNGNGLFGGNGNRETATLDQVDSRFNALQGQLQSESLQAQVGRLAGEVGRTSADSTIALGGAIAGLKDAVNHNAAHVNLALCGLGHGIQAGFAQVNQNIIQTAATTQIAALQENLAQARLALATAHSDAKHTATQVMIQNLVKA